MATPKRNSPAPSRRCSGSRSRADRPIDRATAPTAWAMPSHTAATPLPSTPKLRATGPGPLLTARGAGREPERRADALEPLRPFAEERGAGRLLVLRDRVLEPLVVRLDPDVLELRDPGGEDVRVAMVRPYGHVTPVTGTTGVRVECVSCDHTLWGRILHPPFPLSDVLLIVIRVTRATWVPGASRNRR